MQCVRQPVESGQTHCIRPQPQNRQRRAFIRPLASSHSPVKRSKPAERIRPNTPTTQPPNPEGLPDHPDEASCRNPSGKASSRNPATPVAHFIRPLASAHSPVKRIRQSRQRIQQNTFYPTTQATCIRPQASVCVELSTHRTLPACRGYRPWRGSPARPANPADI